jgi:hypothetical protein
VPRRLVAKESRFREGEAAMRKSVADPGRSVTSRDRSIV